MTTPIRIKIDVTKIDKSALFQGAKGTYLDATLWPTPDNQYGDDYRVTQDIGKERRQAGEKGAILGNAKLMHELAKQGGQRQPAPPPPRPSQASAPQQTEEEDHIPF